MAKKQEAISCPDCGSGGLVKDVRAANNGVMRRYRCRENPEHRWTTLEVVAKRSHGKYAGQGGPLVPVDFYQFAKINQDR